MINNHSVSCHLIYVWKSIIILRADIWIIFCCLESPLLFYTRRWNKFLSDISRGSNLFKYVQSGIIDHWTWPQFKTSWWVAPRAWGATGLQKKPPYYQMMWTLGIFTPGICQWKWSGWWFENWVGPKNFRKCFFQTDNIFRLAVTDFKQC